ncbi:MAG: hypothetical protein JWO16_1046 [Sphingomonas bacterium]|nr:hypothetical protein [Sphingomonas bacterium]
MKILMKRLAGMAAIAALAMPSVAMASPDNPAAKLSVAGSVRAPAKAKGANKLGGSTLINLAIFAVIVGGGLLLITKSDKSKSP